MKTGILFALGALAGAASSQTLQGDALVKALRQGGYVIVMRHARSPLEVPDKQTANPDNVKPERQLDAKGRATTAAGAHGPHSSCQHRAASSPASGSSRSSPKISSSARRHARCPTSPSRS